MSGRNERGLVGRLFGLVGAKRAEARSTGELGRYARGTMLRDIVMPRELEAIQTPDGSGAMPAARSSTTSGTIRTPDGSGAMPAARSRVASGTIPTPAGSGAMPAARDSTTSGAIRASSSSRFFGIVSDEGLGPSSLGAAFADDDSDNTERA